MISAPRTGGEREGVAAVLGLSIVVDGRRLNFRVIRQLTRGTGLDLLQRAFRQGTDRVVLDVDADENHVLGHEMLSVKGFQSFHQQLVLGLRLF